MSQSYIHYLLVHGILAHAQLPVCSGKAREQRLCQICFLLLTRNCTDRLNLQWIFLQRQKFKCTERVIFAAEIFRTVRISSHLSGGASASVHAGIPPGPGTPPGIRHPPRAEQTPPPWTGHSGPDTHLGADPLDQAPPGTRNPPVDRQTPVKT